MSTDINNSEDNASETFHILVYGAERKGYVVPTSDVRVGSIKITFAPFDTELKFQNFDGVILFQGIWARWRQRNSLYGNDDDYLTDVQNDMLRVRVKQLQSLEAKGGFIVFLMDRMVHDDFDLAKEVLSWFPSTYYNSIDDNEFFRKIYFNELASYFKSDYGVSKTKFTHHGDADFRVIADTSNYDGNVAVSFYGKFFFLPCHVVKKDEKGIEDLFRTLVPGLVGTYRKLNQELPKWIDDFKFITEKKFIEDKKTLKEKLSSVDEEITKFVDFKKPLVLTGPALAESLLNLMKNGMGLDVTGEDNGYEDLQLWDKSKQNNGAVIAVIESKGVNGNVLRENINQVDDHRERNGFRPDFPGILIANTFIKSSNTLEHKNKPIEQEQVNHAIKMGVIILRTLDVIRAYDLILSGRLKSEDFKTTLLTEKGWLEVTEEKITIHR